MTDPNAHDLGPNSWAERSAHVVQGSLSYAAAASPSRGAAVVDAEMMSTNNAAADDLESDPGFVRNCVRMSAFEKEHYHPNNIMPERPLSAVFAVNQTSENSVNDIFQDLQNIGVPAQGVRCLQRVSNDHFCITFGKENYRNTFLKKSSFIPHFSNGRPQLPGSSNLVYVAAYDIPFEMSDEAIRNRLSRFGVVRSSRRCKLQTMPGIFNGIRVFGMEISKPVPSFLRFGRYLVRLKHKDQTPTCRKCNRPGHQAKTCPNTFCFNCEELGHMSDSCPEEVYCCICRVTGHMAADCPYSWNRRSSILRPEASDTPLQQPSPLNASSNSAQASQQSSEPTDHDTISPEQFSQSSDLDSQSLLPSQQSLLSTQPSESSGVDSQALSSQQSSQSSDEPSHSSSNSSGQSKHVADSHPLQPSQKTLHSSLSTKQSSSGPQSLFVFSPPSAEPETPHATHSSAPPSSGWIPATSKSSDLELAAVASLASAELSISNDESSQATQPSQSSVQDDDNMGDSPPSVGITKEIAVAVKESSRPAKKRVGQRTPAKRVSSGPPPRKPTTPRLVTSKR